MASHVAELALQRGWLAAPQAAEGLTFEALQAQLTEAQTSLLWEQARRRDELALQLLLTQNQLSPQEAEALIPASPSEPERPSVLRQALSLKSIDPAALAALLDQALMLATDQQVGEAFQESPTLIDQGDPAELADAQPTMDMASPMRAPELADATPTIDMASASARGEFQEAPTLVDQPGGAPGFNDAAPTLLQSGQGSGPPPMDTEAPTLISPASQSGAPSTRGSLMGIAGSGSGLDSARGPGVLESAGSGSSPSEFGSSPAPAGSQSGSQGSAYEFSPTAQSGLGSSGASSGWSQSSGGSHESRLVMNVEELVGKEIEGWKISKLLGKGAMGAVYRARNAANERAAIKVILPGLKNALDYIPRFRQEAEVVNKLDHPHIIRALSYSEEPFPYLILEFVEGRDLKSHLKKVRRMDVASALRISRPILEALQHAHDRDIIHRDLKPENILLDKDGMPKISDFGLGREVGEGEDQRLTLTGRAMGTPYYMPPEQIDDAKSADERSDLYAFGAMLFRILTGQPPFTGTQAQILTAHYQKAPPRVRAWVPKAPSSLEQLILDLMAKVPEERPQTAGEVLERIGDVERELAALSAETSIGQKLKLGVGDELNGWRLDGELGAGGMGKVFKASRGEQVSALKVLAPTVASDATARQRFEREIEVTKELEHPNIVRVFDSGVATLEDLSYPYMAMEYYKGQDLSAVLEARGPLDPKDAVAVCIGAARALAFSSKQGVVHRDVKPENMLLTDESLSEDSVRMTDFGVAAFTHQASNLTQTTAAVGSPYYMAPEQAKSSDSLDVRADIYALGATLYHLLTGRRLFTAENIQGLLIAHARELPMRADEVLSGVPEDLAWIVDYCVLKQVDDRPETMEELLGDLEAWRDGRLSRERVKVIKRKVRKGRSPFEPGSGWGPWIIAALLLLTVTISGVLIFRPAPEAADPYATARSNLERAQGRVGAASQASGSEDPKLAEQFDSRLKAALLALDDAGESLASADAQTDEPPPAGFAEALDEGRGALVVAARGWLEQELARSRVGDFAVVPGLKRAASIPAITELAEAGEGEEREALRTTLAALRAELEGWERARGLDERLSELARTEARRAYEVGLKALEDGLTAAATGFRFEVTGGESHPIVGVLLGRFEALSRSLQEGFAKLEGRLVGLEERAAALKGRPITTTAEADALKKDVRAHREAVTAFVSEIPGGNTAVQGRAAALLDELSRISESIQDPKQQAARTLLTNARASFEAGRLAGAMEDILGLLAAEFEAYPEAKQAQSLRREVEAALEARFAELVAAQVKAREAKFLLAPEDFQGWREELAEFEQRASLEGRWPRREALVSAQLERLTAAERAAGAALVARGMAAYREGFTARREDSVSRAGFLAWLEAGLREPARAGQRFALGAEAARDAAWLLGEADLLEGLHGDGQVRIEAPASEAVTIGRDDAWFSHAPARRDGEVVTAEGRRPLGRVFVDRCEVSVELYGRFLAARARLSPAEGEAPYEPADWEEQRSGDAQLPVRNIRFEDARAFARWAGKRLPYEEEWELAARWAGGGGEDGRRYAWGDVEPGPTRARYGGEAGPVGVKTLRLGATPAGILHLTGNVAEWTASRLDIYEGGLPAAFRRLPRGQAYVVRGGSYASEVPELDVWLRGWQRPAERSPLVGLRCVCDD